MALVQINKNPSPRELKWFGVLFAAFFGLVGLLAWRPSGPAAASYALWGVGLAVPAVYYAFPSVRRTIYLGWIYATFPIGWVVSQVVLAVVYFAVFTPVGLALRLLGKDPLQRGFDLSRKSYWVERRDSRGPSRYFNQY